MWTAVVFASCVPEITVISNDAAARSDSANLPDTFVDRFVVDAGADGSLTTSDSPSFPETGPLDIAESEEPQGVDVTARDAVDERAAPLDAVPADIHSADALTDRLENIDAETLTDAVADVSPDRACVSCSAANASSVCIDGSCRIEACASGFGDCNGALADGCEQSLRSDLANCGRCGNRCQSGACVAGGCVITACPSGMVLIPAGTFTMGSSVGEPMERPVHLVELAAFCIDTTEVTVAAYSACTASGCSRPTTGVTYNWGVKGRENHPINGVDWFQASAFCRWRSSAALPTEAQWEYAARGGDERPYPWGFDAPGSQLCWSGGGSFRTSTCPVRSFPAGASPAGLFDMAGNVWEWTADWMGDYTSGGSAAALNPTGPSTGAERVFRGGQWFSSVSSAVRTTSRGSADPSFRDFAGFRCVLNGS
jgi:formylglycine-generating enzyme required for sulfatase activity